MTELFGCCRPFLSPFSTMTQWPLSVYISAAMTPNLVSHTGNFPLKTRQWQQPRKPRIRRGQSCDMTLRPCQSQVKIRALLQQTERIQHIKHSLLKPTETVQFVSYSLLQKLNISISYETGVWGDLPYRRDRESHYSDLRVIWAAPSFSGQTLTNC